MKRFSPWRTRETSATAPFRVCSANKNQDWLFFKGVGSYSVSTATAKGSAGVGSTYPAFSLNESIFS